MARARKAVAALRRKESGFTLIELLVATTLGLLVVGGAMTMFLSAVRSEPRTAAQVSAIQQARVTVERIGRELRQGLEVPAANPEHLEIVTYVKGTDCAGVPSSSATPCRVIYHCEATSCTRAVAEPDGTGAGAAVLVATDLASSGIFTYEPGAEEPTYVGIELAVANDGGDPIELEDGAALRNLPAEEEEEA